jgi:hypothetical protein
MQVLVGQVFAAWRRAERLAESYPDGSPERAAAADACRRLRDLYQDLTRGTAHSEAEHAEVLELIADLAENT